MNKKIINNLFNYAIEKDADNITIESEEKRVSLNYYYQDEVIASFSLNKKLEKEFIDKLHEIIKVKNDEPITKRYTKLHNKNFDFNFYLTTLTNKFGTKIIINIVKKNKQLWRIKQLGLQLSQLKLIGKTVVSNSGLIVISSPYNSGKSTTLYSLLQEVNIPELDTYLLEKNPEHIIPGVNQLNPNKSNWDILLRNDSDIIVLDDCDTIADLTRALRAANSGRLVIISMTANSSWEILLKILKTKLPLEQKVNTIKLIINQRVVDLKRAKTKKDLSRTKIGIFETLEIDAEIREFIFSTRNDPEKKQFWEKLAKIAIKNGFISIKDDLRNKIKNKLLNSNYQL